MSDYYSTPPYAYSNIHDNIMSLSLEEIMSIVLGNIVHYLILKFEKD